MRLGACLVSLAAAVPSSAAAFSLLPPVDCTLGETCFIQQYVDLDASEGAADFTCGPLTYDGHKGTDFALPDLAAMARGTDVLASAAGTVTGRRDGMPDISPSAPGAPDISGRECGNGVLIDHGDGWETQYCHMAQGSVAVAEGDSVEAGQRLGRVGMSGEAEFPHVHLGLRKDGAVVDPFVPDADACGQIPDPLWASPLPYQPGGIVSLGFSDGLPDFGDILAGTAGAPVLAADGAALVVWGHVFGGRAGDTVELVIRGPQGAVFETTEKLDRTQARLFRAGGRRTPDDGWTPGLYIGEVTLRREGRILDRKEGRVKVE